jgi:hypothetical protein
VLAKCSVVSMGEVPKPLEELLIGNIVLLRSPGLIHFEHLE